MILGICILALFGFAGLFALGLIAEGLYIALHAGDHVELTVGSTAIVVGGCVAMLVMNHFGVL